MLEDVTPPNDLDPVNKIEILRNLVSYVFDLLSPPLPPSSVPRTTAHIPKTSLQTGGEFCGQQDYLNHWLAWTGHPAGHPAASWPP